MDSKQVLAEAASYLASKGKGILASDSDEKDLGNKFKPLEVENTFENRRAYREMLYTTEDIDKYLSGVILVDESVRQRTQTGLSFPEHLRSYGVAVGLGLDPFNPPFIEGTSSSQISLQELAVKFQEYYSLGIQFMKWRVVYRVGPNQPSEKEINDNAEGMAKYALMCQQYRIVPIIEPDMVADGGHSMEDAEKCVERILVGTYKVLQDKGVFLEGTILKPSFCRPGTDNQNIKLNFTELVTRTLSAYSKHVPSSVPGINFLSGGLSESDASLALSKLNKLTNFNKPWNLSFCYGRALQNSTIKAWNGKNKNVGKAQEVFRQRCKDNSDASQGKYNAPKKNVEKTPFPQQDLGVDAKQELAKVAAYMASKGKGVLASDEGTKGLGDKFKPLGVENTEENRRAYREMLYSAEGIGEYISGVILVDESVRQKSKSGQTFPELLRSKGVISGCGLDSKDRPFIEGTDKEKMTLGLDDLVARTHEYYSLGVQFAKWRSVLRVGLNQPSDLAIYENALGLAKYALICQQSRLVPIIEPDLVADGGHDMEQAEKAMEKVLSGTIKVLQDNKVFLEGIILKPSFVRPGTDNKDIVVNFEELALRTVRACSHTVPPCVPSINFLSGGLAEKDATTALNCINKLENIRKPWNLSFTFGRALQNSAVKKWSGKEENVKAAQDIFIERCKANSEASLGQFGDEE